MKGRSWFLWTVFALAFALFGCSANSSTDGTGGNGQGATANGGSAQGGDGQGGECIFCNGGNGQGGGGNGILVVTPQSATLAVMNGNVPTQNFTATLNGVDVTSQVTWGFDKPGIGTMGGNTFTPTGTQGGAGQLTAKYNSKDGVAAVTVNVTITENPAGLTPQEQAAFDSPAGPDPSLTVLYPYDQTVMPLRIASPELQWQGGAGGDIYRIRYQANHINYTVFTSMPSGNGLYTLGQQSWEDVEFSTEGPQTDPLHMSIERRSGPTIYAPVNFDLRIAQGFIYGVVYYWQLPDACGGDPNGVIKRVRADSPTTETFFSPGGCWGCHTVSRDGNQLSAEFNNGNGPLRTVNLATNPATYGTLYDNVGNHIFAAFDNTGTRLLANDNTAYNPSQAVLKLIDVPNATILNQNAMATGCGEPAWSPDGTKVAAICGLTGGGWVFDASGGNLSVADAANDNISNVTAIVPQAGGPGRPAYPSFSPDSQYIAYGRPTSGSRSTGNGKLYLTDVAGQSVKTLQTASSDDKSFNPVFAPKAAGGYTWIVFVSRRNYGHQMVNTNRQQLWVTAIDDPPGAADPSHPPFYLRGQEMCGKSENAYYALEPCKADGADCTHGVECCNKTCINGKCEQIIGGQCIPTNSGLCDEDADCCDYTGPGSAVTCVAGFCEQKPPQ